MVEQLLRTEALRKWFPQHPGLRGVLGGDRSHGVLAVDGVDLSIGEGEVVGLAGESGSGKTVTAELIAGLQPPTSGAIYFRGVEIVGRKASALRDFRRQVSMIFQDPFDSLNPRWRIDMAIAEPLRIHGVGTRRSRQQTAFQMLERVQLEPADYYAERYPHELSGGERQRAAVARALVLKPRLLIADEPTTMLDVSIRAGLLNLLRDLQGEQGLSMLFISHDFSTLAYLCDRISIMYKGVVVEEGRTKDVLQRRLHPYTRALAAAIPQPDPHSRRPRVEVAEEARRASTPEGCRFEDRCPERMEQCSVAEPLLETIPGAHSVACYRHSVTEPTPSSARE